MNKAVRRVDTAQTARKLRAEIVRDVDKFQSFLRLFGPGSPYPTAGDFDLLEKRARDLAGKCARLRDMEAWG